MASNRAMDFTRFINAVSKARKPSPIRKMSELLLASPPSLISLAGGMPNPSLFPFQSIEIKATHDISLKLSGKELSNALQYCSSAGSPVFRKWILELHKTYHKPPILGNLNGPQFDFCVTSGSQDGLGRAFDMLLDEGDTVLVDNPCYPGTLALLNPLPVTVLPIATDDNGMMSSSLKDCLTNFKTNDNQHFPKIMYTIPHCSNPTGVSASTNRKKEIYQIAQEFDMLIIEDDPYFFLQYSDEIPLSYQALDIDGRVLRCDSFSKVLSAGMRLGWISGAAPLIERIMFHIQSSSLHASSVTQTIAGTLLDAWEIKGFREHVIEICSFYKNQRNIMLKSCQKWLSDLAEWNEPDGGMFLWIKVKGVSDTTSLIQNRAFANDVALLPGSVFEVISGTPSPYVRASFSTSTADNIDLGIQRFASAIRDELESQKN